MGEWLGVAAALAIVGLFFNIGGIFFPPTTPEENTGAIDMNTDNNSAGGSAEALKIEDLVVGKGETAVSGKTITVNYVGTLTNGTKFDSSYDREAPFSFTLGEGRVIQGWERGVEGMKVGGKRKLVIPPGLGYGNQPMGRIPANSTLVFEIELLKVE